MKPLAIACLILGVTAGSLLAVYFWQSPDEFVSWLASKSAERTHLFERVAIESELGILKEFAAKQQRGARERCQLALL